MGWMAGWYLRRLALGYLHMLVLLEVEYWREARHIGCYHRYRVLLVLLYRVGYLCSDANPYCCHTLPGSAGR